MGMIYNGANPSAVMGSSKKKKKVRPARIKMNPLKSKIVSQHKTLMRKARKAGA